MIDSTSRSVRIRWKPPFHGNSPIKSYFIDYAKPESKDWQTVEMTHSGLEYLLTGLVPISTYKVRIRAVNEIGVSESSLPITVLTSEEVPGGPPLSVRLEASGAQSVKVRWFAPKKELRFGKIKGYYIGYRVADQEESFNYKNVEIENDQSLEKEMSSYITNLKRRTNYEVVIQAYNAIGTGPRSDEVRVTTLHTSPPTTPSLRFISSSYDSITIGWHIYDPRGDGDYEKRSFIIHYKAETSFEWAKLEIMEGKNHEYRLNNLKCGSKYEIYMIAKNSLGIGEPSKAITARTKGGAPVSPSTLAQFATINITSISLNLGEETIDCGSFN